MAAMAADTGCDMTEEELLAMLKGISSSKGSRAYGGGADASDERPAEEMEATKSAFADAPDAPVFLADCPEKHALNQYWYSPATIEAIAGECTDACAALPDDDAALLGACLVSTPSVYFSLPPDARAKSYVLDLDEQWKDDRGFVRYDFNAPAAVPDALKHKFAIVVVDPPFITREVWTKYAETARLLVAPGGKLLCTTIAENAPMLEELLGVKPNKFLPSIPHLVYQYNLYTDYKSERLDQPNKEIPAD